MRRALIGIARTEPATGHLIVRFEELLRDKCQTELAALLFERGTKYESRHFCLSKDVPWLAAVCELGWITPEALERRRSNPALAGLGDFLGQRSIGLIITVPRGSPNPALLLAFRTKVNESPFTYPEVERLQKIAELMDNILIRSRLTAQEALHARIEYLAMMSRGLAHDLKNLITPVSTFLVHTDGAYRTGSPEAEVHAAARRAMRVMTDYVREAMFFAERLKPRFEKVSLSPVLSSVHSVAKTRADARSVSLDVVPPQAPEIVADAVLLQRLLTNLVHNAIDASKAGQSVRLRVNYLPPGHVQFQVSDDGSGISPENLARVFEPYFTTKVFGDEVRGFGLGLTICQTIAELHHGRIEVQSETGKGTRVAVTLPTTQVTSDDAAGSMRVQIPLTADLASP
jgi:signal transduction histidine kinase